nr:nuclear distribution protein nude [Quercus suber]
MTSSPLRSGASLEEELDYYKKQYEQLETDLADFQASSKELEEQLERDIESAERNERKLKEEVEKLKFEVEEWKTKHRQAKTEANSAQTTLQKEITSMRETNRTLTMKLRDIEVMNDDFERQARNTESSLEDLESKYNVAIERSVLLDTEVKNGEQERESLRVETQRLRDELGDLKIESEITIEKLRLADKTIERLRSRKPSPLAVETLRTRSPGSDASVVTSASPTASTPPPRSDTMSEAPTPPSPPLSDTPTHARVDPKTPLQAKSKPKPQSATPRPSLHGPRAATASRHARGPSTTSSKSGPASDAKSMQPPLSRSRPVTRPSIAQEPLPRSESLLQIKGLRSRMAKIEERVHSARSKLPAPKDTTPRGSPRNMTRSPRNIDNIPSSITVRRTSKRPSSSVTSTSQQNSAAEESSASEAYPSRRESLVKRLSYSSAIPTVASTPRPASTTGSRHSITSNGVLDRPASALDRRPPSRSSMARPPSRTGADSGGIRPPSSTSVRPRTSMGGIGPPPSKSLHRPSASVTELRRLAADDLASSGDNISPTKSSSGHARRQSGRISFGYGSSQSIHEEGLGEMRPPSRITNGTHASAHGSGRRRQMSDVGETY